MCKKKEVKKKHAGGRPTKYKPEYCKIVADLMYDGWALVSVARELKVSRETLYEWGRVHPRFSDALKKGAEASEGWWTEQGRTNLHSKTFSSTLWYMNMKNRFGWRDKQDITSDNEKIEGVVFLPSREDNDK